MLFELKNILDILNLNKACSSHGLEERVGKGVRVRLGSVIRLFRYCSLRVFTSFYARLSCGLSSFNLLVSIVYLMGHAVASLVALCYEPEVSGFECR
jgi:hypothetical protein